MRKRVIAVNERERLSGVAAENWLDLADAIVEVSSEEPEYPIEHALSLDADEHAMWRAAAPGKQTVRIIFDKPCRLSRIYLVFEERARPRSQEFLLAWSSDEHAEPREFVRQQWNFSPEGACVEVEDFKVSLENVKVVQLVIQPDRQDGVARATLQRLRLA